MTANDTLIKIKPDLDRRDRHDTSLPMNRPTLRVPGPGTLCLLITNPPPDVAAYRLPSAPARNRIGPLVSTGS